MGLPILAQFSQIFFAFMRVFVDGIGWWVTLGQVLVIFARIKQSMMTSQSVISHQLKLDAR
ncbi:hypothetical protein B0680_04870 [Moraxella pluranimalium]|uniref:Uncharacterized protein n=1 Tax=Moraxella pluranimalium TaxID=470453 RepID=A0A1T0CP49_9GAMM|nr:hypothetical protein B0680_04870 [Moraxella pluranimalium]